MLTEDQIKQLSSLSVQQLEQLRAQLISQKAVRATRGQLSVDLIMNRLQDGLAEDIATFVEAKKADTVPVRAATLTTEKVTVALGGVQIEVQVSEETTTAAVQTTTVTEEVETTTSAAADSTSTQLTPTTTVTGIVVRLPLALFCLFFFDEQKMNRPRRQTPQQAQHQPLS